MKKHRAGSDVGIALKINMNLLLIVKGKGLIFQSQF